MADHPDQFPPPQRPSVRPPPLPQPPPTSPYRPAIDHGLRAAPLDPLASRRASTIMIALGVLLLIAGGLMLATPLLPSHDLDARAEEFRAQARDFFAPGASLADVRRFIIRTSLGVGSFLAGLGVIQLWFGLLVRQGNRTAAAAAAGLGLVMLAGLGALIAGALVTGTPGTAIILLFPAAVIAVQCVQLLKALRDARQVDLAIAPLRLEPGDPAAPQPPPLPLTAQLPVGDPPVFDYNFAASQRLPPPPAASARR